LHIVAEQEELAAEDARRRDQCKESYAAVMIGEVCQHCTPKESKPRQDQQPEARIAHYAQPKQYLTYPRKP
jgi:hypothetical protein